MAWAHPLLVLWLLRAPWLNSVRFARALSWRREESAGECQITARIWSFDPLMEREKEVSWLGGRLQASSAVPGRWDVLATDLPQSPLTPSKGPSPWAPPASPGWEQQFISPLSEGSEQGVHIYNSVCPLAVVFRLGVYKESVLRSLAVDFPMPHCSLLHRLLLALYWCLVFQA